MHGVRDGRVVRSERTFRSDFATKCSIGGSVWVPTASISAGMRFLAVPAVALLVFNSCARQQPVRTSSASTSASPPTVSARTTPLTLPPISSTIVPVPTTAPQTGPPSSRSPAPSSAVPSSTGRSDAVAATPPTGDPAQVATSFVRAALDADPVTLAQLTHPSYSDAAQRLWISDGGPSNQAILAAKVLTLAAGHARVAVFVDAGDLALAALPYTVELTQNPATGLWSVIDVGLSQP